MPSKFAGKIWHKSGMDTKGYHMEVLNSILEESSVTLNSSGPYLERQACPGCFTVTSNAKLEVQSNPAAENLPIDQHGKFLSGYTNQRVFFSYVRCTNCELLYSPIYFTQAQLDHLYGKQSENMAEVPLKARALTQNAYYQLLRKYHTPCGQYLEIGADIGLFAKYFAEDPKISSLYLYEPNHEVHEALAKCVGSKDYKIMTTNYTADDIEPSSLNTAVIIHALDHVLNPSQLMQDIYRNLAPGGVVFIVTHDESSLLARVLRKKWPPYTLQHPQLFKPSTIKKLLRSQGFDILACQKTSNYFPLTHFIKGGLTSFGLDLVPIPEFSNFIIPIKLGNIATIAQKPYGV